MATPTTAGPVSPLDAVAALLAFGLVAAAVATLAMVLTLLLAAGPAAVTADAACCLGFVPVVMQTVFQPLFHFARGLSLMLLRQMGYDPAARSKA
jgi:hypothetical protein